MHVKQNLAQNLAQMKARLVEQITSRVEKVDLQSVLGLVGLQLAKTPKRMALPMLAAFGSGLALGALLAPMKGKDLRARITALAGKLKSSGNGAIDDDQHEKSADGQPIESPYDKAKSQQREPRANGQRKGARPGDDAVTASAAAT